MFVFVIFAIWKKLDCRYLPLLASMVSVLESLEEKSSPMYMAASF